MMGTTSSGTLMVLLGTYAFYVRTDERDPAAGTPALPGQGSSVDCQATICQAAPRRTHTSV